MDKKLSSHIAKIQISSSTELELRCFFPDENPDGAIQDITRTLQYVGVFDNL